MQSHERSHTWRFQPARLREALEAADLSGPKLAKLLGVHKMTIWRLENGLQTRPKWDLVERIGLALRQDPVSFFAPDAAQSSSADAQAAGRGDAA